MSNASLDMEDIATQIQAKTRQFAARKTQVTLKLKGLQTTLDKANSLDSWTQASENEVEDRIAAVKEQLAKLELLGEDLTSLYSETEKEVDEEDVVTYDPEAKIQELWDQFQAYNTQAADYIHQGMEVITDLVKAGPPQGQQQAGGGGAAGGDKPHKDNPSMKPGTLTPKHSPGWFREWQRLYRAYYTSSNMDNMPLEVQQEYLLRVIDEDLRSKVRPQITAHTAIYGTRHNPGVMEILKTEFLHAYPLFLRRMDFFSAEQGTTENFAEYHTRLRSLADEADIGLEILAIRLVIGLRDKRMREQMLLLNTDDYTRLRDCGLSYQAMTTANNKLSAASSATSSNVYPKSGKGKGKSSGNNGKSSQQSSNGQAPQSKGGAKQQGGWAPKVINGKCGSCGKKDGCKSKDACKAKDHKCNCGYTGHFDRLCRRGKATSNATSVAPNQDGTTAKKDD